MIVKEGKGLTPSGLKSQTPFNILASDTAFVMSVQQELETVLPLAASQLRI